MVKRHEPTASRQEAEQTQVEAAALLGVHRRTWQDWERDVAPIPPAMLALYRHMAGLERIPFRSKPEGK